MPNFTSYNSPICCGLKSIFGFSRWATMDRGLKEAFLKELESISSKRAFLVEAVLNSDQHHFHNNFLLEVGFVMVRSWINPNTRNKCYLYVFPQQGDEVKEGFNGIRARVLGE